MLVLSRKEREKLILRDQRGLEIVISVERVGGAHVRLGISAPQNIEIIREEILDQWEGGPSERRDA